MTGPRSFLYPVRPRLTELPTSLGRFIYLILVFGIGLKTQT